MQLNNTNIPDDWLAKYVDLVAKLPCRSFYGLQKEKIDELGAYFRKEKQGLNCTVLFDQESMERETERLDECLGWPSPEEAFEYLSAGEYVEGYTPGRIAKNNLVFIGAIDADQMIAITHETKLRVVYQAYAKEINKMVWDTAFINIDDFLEVLERTIA